MKRLLIARIQPRGWLYRAVRSLKADIRKRQLRVTKRPFVADSNLVGPVLLVSPPIDSESGSIGGDTSKTGPTKLLSATKGRLVTRSCLLRMSALRLLTARYSQPLGWMRAIRSLFIGRDQVSDNIEKVPNPIMPSNPPEANIALVAGRRRRPLRLCSKGSRYGDP